MSSAEIIPGVGTEAPDFRLPSLEHGEVAPSDYRGKQKVVIAFYSTDNTSS